MGRNKLLSSTNWGHSDENEKAGGENKCQRKPRRRAKYIGREKELSFRDILPREAYTTTPRHARKP